MYQKWIALGLFVFLLAGPASTQTLSQQEIDEAVETMRKSGAPDETINQFLDSVAAVNALQQSLEISDVQRTAPETPNIDSSIAPEMKGLIGLLNNFSELDAASKSAKLEMEIAAFAEAHEGKNDVPVTLGTTVHELKLMRCDYDGETFVISAEGTPYEAGRKGPVLSASRTGPYASGDSGGSYLETLNFEAPGIRIGSNRFTTLVDGQNIRISARVDSGAGDGTELGLQISLECS